jgi:membrane protein implicated in regulation of membrane protease activity
MTGNAVEEGLMQQLGNPSHLDAGRIVVPAALLSGIGAGWLALALIPRLAFLGALALGAMVTIAVAFVLARWLARRAEARAVAELQRRRRDEVAAGEAALARMREQGR